MLGFKKKNYLKRTDFINSIDCNKIWSKSMTIDETKLLLEQLENELSKYDFDEDKNFIMNARRKTLKGMIEERLQKNENNINELVSESLFNFCEFVGDEYPGGGGGIMNDCRELGISIHEFDAMDKSYREKGIICAQEKDTILEMIQLIKKHLDKDNNFNKIEFLKANYGSPEQWAESTIKAHSHHEPIKEEYLERLKNCKTWDDVLILLEEVVPFLTR